MFKLSSPLVGLCIQKTLAESLVVYNVMSFSWADMAVKEKAIVILLKQVKCNISDTKQPVASAFLVASMQRRHFQKHKHTGVFCKHPEYILITERFHVTGKDGGSCALNKDYVMLPERGSNADAERGKEQVA